LLNTTHKLYLIPVGCQWNYRGIFLFYNKNGICEPQWRTVLRRALRRCDTLMKRAKQRQKERLTSMEEQRPVQGQVQIKADEKELQGEYSNLVMIHHNLEEFTLNFIYIFPNGQQGKLLKSMIVSPGHAKRIFRALGENIARYEAQFGTIKEMPEGGPTPNVGFIQ
jgi:hypothetical protein